ncbi:hypothetical protein M431DRAFT_490604 [Trichoderma harzianum CBS 226.95]|uniref:Uncharacterized protein n=1 Tax=Trichoderma harzianum CBS 226.95 TaxID=983964 RepID=A0A2T4APH3_TRIHA|nr:hypothetical protein M431DRAFT_490604 [Trichoderma harzianum CBS 226.95]PTB58976.1 hypothetical protein M431DRAFT_490604 [Trichoderma harzianum CBS 226.95]
MPIRALALLHLTPTHSCKNLAFWENCTREKNKNREHGERAPGEKGSIGSERVRGPGSGAGPSLVGSAFWAPLAECAGGIVPLM